MAFKDKDLIKPSIYALIAGFFVSVVGLIPIIGVALIFGDSGLVGRGLRTICFAKSRRSAELIHRFASDRLTNSR